MSITTPDPALCTEATNPNYTIGTFRLYVRPEGGDEIEIGNIQTGSFEFAVNTVEHRRGTDNSLDAIFAIGKDYIINFTADEITSGNLSVLLNEDYVTVSGGCQVPFTGDRCVREYGVRLVHQFPCAEKTLTIIFWRAIILSPFTLSFDAGANANFGGIVRAMNCESAHPSNPYGYAFITEACPTS